MIGDAAENVFRNSCYKPSRPAGRAKFFNRKPNFCASGRSKGNGLIAAKKDVTFL